MSGFVSIKVHTVPEYLHTSLFFSTLNEADSDDITLPAEHCKLNTDVNSDEDLLHLLATLQFWGSDEIPTTMLDYFLKNSLERNLQILDELEVEFTTAKVLRKMNSLDQHVTVWCPT